MSNKVPMSRRTFLTTVAAVGVVGGVAACTPGSTSENRRSAARALPIPPLLRARVEDGRKVFSLRAQRGKTRIIPDKDTPTWGYNGPSLGPTLRVNRGDRVRVEVTNDLPDLTTVHWHGMHLPAEMDGGPHQPIEPGARWTPEWTINQQAATLWYHPHPHGETMRQSNRGLAGMVIIDDDNATTSGLPNRYGVDDIPLILADRHLNRDGTLDESDRKDVGLLGDMPIVNGINNPTFTATTRRVRFRILDAATMRLFNLEFSDKRPFHIVASDGGLLDEPQTVTSAYISPGERIEIVVDLKPAETVQLRSIAFADNLELSQDDDTPDFGLGDSFDLMTITGPPATTPPASAALPATMNATLRSKPDLAAAPSRSYDLQWFQINGKRMDMTRVDDLIEPDQWELWTVWNKDNWIHNFHIHDTQFRVLSLTNTSTTPQTEGWKDTILLAPGATATLAVRFTDYTSTRWPYMYHCHLMYHEDQGMMGQFVVVKPGERPDPQIGHNVTMSHAHSGAMDGMPMN